MQLSTFQKKGILFGILGAIAGILPNLFLKSLPVIFSSDKLFINHFQLPILRLEMTNFGFVTILGYGSTLTGIVFPLVLGGGLFGLIISSLASSNSSDDTSPEPKQKTKGLLWWSFIGGILFNLIFIFYVPMLAS